MTRLEKTPAREWLSHILIVLGRFHEEVGMAGAIDEGLGQRRRHTVECGNTDDLFDQVTRVTTPHIHLVILIHMFQQILHGLRIVRHTLFLEHFLKNMLKPQRRRGGNVYLISEPALGDHILDKR